MTTLYELTAQHQKLQTLTDGNPDEMRELLADTFEAIEGEYNDKAVALITVSNNLDSDIIAIDTEIKRLQDRRKITANKRTHLRDYLRDNMEAAGISNIKCPLFSITLAKGRDTVGITDAKAIPADYIAVKVSKSPDKTLLLARLKEGESIPGAVLGKSRPSLRIK
ncbi:MAG: siphovirus Gp157 family protein [Planctomycetes bacterium]|nr:siphovirus Gp157 family protein [Planctomycetota bacterium]